MSLSHEGIVTYYNALPRSGGFDSRCDMFAPGGLDRAFAIDLGCRRGKGTYKLSDLVGPMGHVYGIDWAGDMIETARMGAEAALKKNGLAESNMEFVVCYPEELVQDSGIMEESVDVVYVNSVLNLMYDPAEVLKQIGAILKPAGILYCQTVLATMPRDKAVVEEARKMGNPIQAAPFRKDFARWLHEAGMDMPTFDILDSRPVRVDEGAEEGASVPVVASDEEAFFSACVVRIDKLGGFDYQAFLRDDISQFR